MTTPPQNSRSKTIPKSVTDVSELSPLIPIVEHGAFAPLIQLARYLLGYRATQHKMCVQLDNYERLCKKEGLLLSVIFGKNIVMVYGAEIARQVFRDEKTFPKVEFGNPNSVVSRFLGRNVVFVSGDEWRFHRSVMNPAFADTGVFMPVFLDKALQLCSKFSGILDSDGATDIRVNDWMSRMTVDILGLTVFDFDFKTLDSRSEFDEIGLAPVVAANSTMPKSEQFLHNFQFLFSCMSDIVESETVDV